MQIHSRLSRLNTARGSGTGLVTVGPAKVKACKSLKDSVYTHGNKYHLCIHVGQAIKNKAILTALKIVRDTKK